MSQTSAAGMNAVISDPSIVRSGASGIVVYILGKKMYVANVGNALAVVSKGGSARLVSRKHDPYDQAETARIRAAEGWISPSGLVGDEIDISRSFGFYHLMPIVNARPDIFSHNLTELDEFVIIANRGLWDYVSYQTAVDIARQTEPMTAAQKLRDLAISCGDKGSTMIMVISVAELFQGQSTPSKRKKHGPQTAERLKHSLPQSLGIDREASRERPGNVHSVSSEFIIRWYAAELFSYFFPLLRISSMTSRKLILSVLLIPCCTISDDEQRYWNR
jgi:adenylate cyclase